MRLLGLLKLQDNHEKGVLDTRRFFHTIGIKYKILVKMRKSGSWLLTTPWHGPAVAETWITQFLSAVPPTWRSSRKGCWEATGEDQAYEDPLTGPCSTQAESWAAHTAYSFHTWKAMAGFIATVSTTLLNNSCGRPTVSDQSPKAHSAVSSSSSMWTTPFLTLWVM